jgi:mediator of RNA polymerase II transcription subunit 14
LILIRCTSQTIIDLAEQQAQYLGLHTHRTRNFPAEGILCRRLLIHRRIVNSFFFHLTEILKLGPAIRGKLFIQLLNFPKHYLVLVITDEDVKYALISVEVHTEGMYETMSMVDIAWLDVRRIHGHDIAILAEIAPSQMDAPPDQKRHGTYEREFNSPR